ncbi:PREDICTED: LOB domain-containing protein 30-like [Nicotiana attenuata]|uniref:Lob domain-containing protein 18 n=1 Tax=Nicotiana attenuata TaxID=49451 RepID=A0A314KVF1_NICAT|nr:PREDICTED: LOB domain-containing protein 30-like [Nicotiana attenuata]OIT33242.1 lob domain-containing protein 18 [Nicotiana attenuata]
MSSNNPSNCTGGGITATGGGGVGGGTSGSSSTGGGGGGGGPCGACKFLRRKCVAGCIFAPYFDSEQGAAHFAAVHKVFGASNVSKLLLHIPVHKRLDAVVTICYEAQARLRDPVYGCVAHIFALQQQVVNLQAELSYLQAHLATLELPTPPPQPPSQQSQTLLPPQPAALSIADLPTAGPSILPAAYDLSSLFDPMVQPSWAMQQPRPSPMDPRHYGGGARAPVEMSPSTTGGGSGDLQELARELLHRHGSPTVVQCTESSALPPQTK